jgi:hypothetical protein
VTPLSKKEVILKQLDDLELHSLDGLSESHTEVFEIKISEVESKAAISIKIP